MIKLEIIIYIINVIFLLFITLLISISVIYRYILNSPILFSFELSTLIFSWMIYIGSYLAEKDHGHIGFDLIINGTEGNMKILLKIIQDIISISILSIIIFYGFKISIISGMKLTAMDISIKYLYFSCSIGLSLTLFLKISRLITNK